MSRYRLPPEVIRVVEKLVRAYFAQIGRQVGELARQISETIPQEPEQEKMILEELGRLLGFIGRTEDKIREILGR